MARPLYVGSTILKTYLDAFRFRVVDLQLRDAVDTQVL